MRFGLALLLSTATLPANPAALSNVHTVYLMPMAHGLDQYMASRLASLHVLSVVADPKLADAVFTDRLGAEFEYRLESMRPKEPAPAEKAQSAPAHSEAPVFSSLSRAKGTVFLVDARTRQVLWSVYEKPGNTSAGRIERTAGRVVSKLKKDLAGK